MLPTFALERPSTVEQVLELLDEDHVPYCGGTELLLAMKVGLLRPEALVDLKGVPELAAITTEGDGLRIGAAATHLAVSTDPAVAERFGILAHVAERVGNPRIRAQGTVGGNLCFAEPKSDLAAILTALDASLELRRRDGGSRSVPMAEFMEGPYWTVREDDELLVAVTVPRPLPAVYLKYQTMERPTIGVALAGSEGSYRLALGAVAEVPALFELSSLDVDVDGVVGEVDPVADLTGSEDYKRHVTGVYVRRAIQRFREEHERG